MFGSEAIAKHVFNILRIRPAITAVIGDPPRIQNEEVAVSPDDGKPLVYPICLHHVISAPYDQDPIISGQLPFSQTITYVVRFIDQNRSDKVIRPAVKDAFKALVVEAASGVVTIDAGDADAMDFNFDILAEAEWPFRTLIENNVLYRQKGFSLTCHVFRG